MARVGLATLLRSDVGRRHRSSHEMISGRCLLLLAFMLISPLVSLNRAEAQTAWQSPTATGEDYNQWSTPSNAFSSNDQYASEDENGQQQDWYNFGFSIPAGSTIDGIEVRIEANDLDWSGNGAVIELSWNGGTSYTSTGYSFLHSDDSDAITTHGGATDTWGRTWSVAEFSDANFRLKLNKNGSDFTFVRVDHIEVKVYYTSGAPAASVTPDGGENLQKLPSNGTNYTFTFTVQNTGTAADSFDLFASASPGTAISIVSVNAVSGDSARSNNLQPDSSQNISVVYSVGGVAAGTVDTLRLRARAVSDTTIDDTGFADLTVIRPNLTFAKAVSPSGTQVPDTDLTYTLTITNGGSDDAVSVAFVDSLAAEVEFKVGSVVNNLPPGITVTVEYSNDGGSSWTYTPVSGGCGAPVNYDGCVTHIRWTLQNDLSHIAPDNTGDVQFVARIS